MRKKEIKSKQFLLLIRFSYFPPANRPRGTVKIHTNLDHTPAVRPVRDGILLAVNLSQRLFRGTVVFELEDINDILQLHHHIRTAYGTLHFRLHILPHQPEQQIENGLIMLFGLVLQIIGNGGKEGTGTLQAALHITLHQVAKERDDVEGVVLGRQVHVRGKQGFNEPFTDLTVGIGQTIDLEITVIALNGQITALVEHRDGTRYLFRRRIKLLIGSLNTFQRTHIEVCMAQNIYQESRRARGEPIVLVFFGIDALWEQAVQGLIIFVSVASYAIDFKKLKSRFVKGGAEND